MEQPDALADVLTALDRLSAEEQETLATIIQRRAAEHGRQRVIAEAREAHREFNEGKCQPTSVDELMGEILS